MTEFIMTEFINAAALQPHPVFAKIYGDKHQDRPCQSIPLTKVIFTVTQDNVLIDNYWLWKGCNATIEITRTDVAVDDNIAEIALMSILNDYQQSTQTFNKKETVLRVACELFSIEKRRAKKRLQDSAKVSVKMRGSTSHKRISNNANGTARSIVAKKIRPYIENLSEKTLWNGIQVIKAIDYLNINCRYDEANALNEALSQSTNRAYSLFLNKYAGELNNAVTDIQLNHRTQYRYAALEWTPFSMDKSNQCVVNAGSIHFPLTMPTLKKHDSEQYVIVSPEIDFKALTSIDPKEVDKVLSIIRQSSDFEFIFFTKHLDIGMNKQNLFPKNMWIAFIAENKQEFKTAEDAMFKIKGVKRLLILRPAEKESWNLSLKTFISGVTPSVKLCDWIVIESSYDNKQKKARMNFATILNVRSYAEKASIPLYLDPGMQLDLSSEQRYPTSKMIGTPPALPSQVIANTTTSATVSINNNSGSQTKKFLPVAQPPIIKKPVTIPWEEI
ncbi:MAG: hypothetical protein WCO98_01240 [bacterium]